jgi:hypothetical protein
VSSNIFKDIFGTSLKPFFVVVILTISEARIAENNGVWTLEQQDMFARTNTFSLTSTKKQKESIVYTWGTIHTSMFLEKEIASFCVMVQM